MDALAAINERFDARWKDRVRALVDGALVEEHRLAPRGPHSDRLARVLRYFRSRPIPGKEIVLEVQPWREYRIGLLTGEPGRAAEPLGEAYGSDDEALHAIFLRRVERLRSAAG
jgi:branched-chain amino acid transport system permease protein